MKARAVMIMLFVGSLVVANLMVAHFGPWALPFTAFFLIGLDLVVRDALHEAWHGQRLVLKMSALIFAGALIAFLLNRDAFWVGVASFSAFALAQSTNTVVYGLMFNKSWLAKVNTSNLAAALVDSVVFVLVAFHEWMPLLIATQWGIKAGGGFFWSLVAKPLRARYPVLRGETTPTRQAVSP